jgi:hypothetical protein
MLRVREGIHTQFWWESRSLTLREKHRWRVFVKTAQGRTFDSERKEGKGDGRNL